MPGGYIRLASAPAGDGRPSLTRLSIFLAQGDLFAVDRNTFLTQQAARRIHTCTQQAIAQLPVHASCTGCAPIRPTKQGC